MKNLLLGLLCLVVMVGCQTYPKKPTYVNGYSGYQVINHSVPDELRPFELPQKVQYVEQNGAVPKQIIVVPKNMTTTAVVVNEPVSTTTLLHTEEINHAK